MSNSEATSTQSLLKTGIVPKRDAKLSVCIQSLLLHTRNKLQQQTQTYINRCSISAVVGEGESILAKNGAVVRSTNDCGSAWAKARRRHRSDTIVVIVSSRNACTGGEIRIDEAPKHHCVVQCTDADGMCADMRAALGAIRRVVWHPQMWQI